MAALVPGRLNIYFRIAYKFKDYIESRENEGTEREAQGVGRDMLCPRKLFLDERKSLC